MTTITSTKRPRRPKTVAAALALAFALTGLTAGTAGPASASTSHVLSGRPGAVGVPATIGDYSYVNGGRMIMPNRWVYRSPATSGTQYVTIRYRMWRYNWTFGQWMFETSTVQPYATIVPGASRAVAPGAVFSVRSLALFADDFIVTWYASDRRTVIGKRIVDQNAVADYRCSWTDGYACQLIASPNGAGIYFGI